MEATKILNEMAKKRNLYGFIAKLYVSDETKAGEFVLECYEVLQKHPRGFTDTVGNKITTDIQNFAFDCGIHCAN